MDVEERTEGVAAGGPDLRVVPRYTVDGEASLLLVNHGSILRCRIVDLSLGGCRIRTDEQCPAGLTVRVEITFKVRGIAFRFCGVTRWTDGKHQVGIRFVDVPSRRWDELTEALAEVAAENVAKAEKLAAEQLAAKQEEAARQATAEAEERQAITLAISKPPLANQPSQPAFRAFGTRSKPMPRAPAALPLADGSAKASPAATFPARPAKRERRSQSRHEVDTSALIYLIKIGSMVSGRILDLSLSGCRIRTDQPFPLGIYTRVEIEFRQEGLPFRLGGVVQAIHNLNDRHSIGIRFLDLSIRKREQVEQLIEEIEEMRGRQRAEGNSGSGDGQ